ncbi:hypothetical protein [Maribacter halichondriae]|uniref:hypothetical protein n=1 Tax=Maribacter halichondriae TaxID=2980554 RepID=UPI0023594143|nr:hypothetical protein [Maribacter sp. Hal144]
MKNKGHLNYLKIHILRLFAVLVIVVGCKNDDNGVQIYEEVEEVAAPEGVITLANLEKQLKISLDDGSLLEESVVARNFGSIVHEGNHYQFESNTFEKISSNGIIVWTKTYTEEVDKSIELEADNIVFYENKAFISYRILDTNTYASEYFLEALDLDNGNSFWSLNVGHRTIPHIYKNRLVTVQYPNGNAPVVFQYRNKSVGDVEAEKTLNDRIGGFVFDSDLIIANSWSDRVFAMDRALNIVWNYDTGAENPRRGSIFQNQYIFYSRDKHLYSLDKNSGLLNWKTALPEPNILGIHNYAEYTYVGQETGTKTMTLSKIKNENGALETSFEMPMSEDYYTTKLIFHKEYLLLVTSPNSDENENQIQVKLIHLPQSKEVWSVNHNIRIRSLKANILSND